MHIQRARDGGRREEWAVKSLEAGQRRCLTRLQREEERGNRNTAEQRRVAARGRGANGAACSAVCCKYAWARLKSLKDDDNATEAGTERAEGRREGSSLDWWTASWTEGQSDWWSDWQTADFYLSSGKAEFMFSLASCKWNSKCEEWKNKAHVICPP